MEGISFHKAYIQMGNNNKKLLVCMALVRPILDYGAVCLNPCTEGDVSALNRLQIERINLQII